MVDEISNFKVVALFLFWRGVEGCAALRGDHV